MGLQFRRSIKIAYSKFIGNDVVDIFIDTTYHRQSIEKEVT